MNGSEKAAGPGSLRERLRGEISRAIPRARRGFFPVVLALGIAMDLAAVWSVRWLPAGDLGGWIELIDVMARHDDPSTIYPETYMIPRELNPNSLALAIGWLASPVFRADTIASILVSLYVVALPLSLLALCCAFGRSKWLSLFAVPMAFNAMFLVGLLNYILAIPLIILALALSRKHAATGRVVAGLLVATCLVLLYFTHVIAFLFGWSMSLATLLLCSEPRRYHRVLWPVLPAVPLFAQWYWRMFVALEPTQDGVTFGTGEGFAFHFPGLDEYFFKIPAWGMRMFRDGTEEIFIIALLLTWMGMVAVSQGRGPGSDGQRGLVAMTRTYCLEVITLCCILAYFCLPSSMHQLALISERVVILVALLLVAWPRLELDTWGRRALLVPLVAVVFTYPILVRNKFVTFERELLGGLPAAISALPSRSRMAYVMWDRNNSLTYMGTLWHVPQAINALENGGVTDEGFASRPYTAVQFRKGRNPKRLPNRFWKSPHMHDYDYVLLLAPTEPREALERADLGLVFHERRWWLFEVLE